jgi:hypothetical protein
MLLTSVIGLPTSAIVLNAWFGEWMGDCNTARADFIVQWGNIQDIRHI